MRTLIKYSLFITGIYLVVLLAGFIGPFKNKIPNVKNLRGSWGYSLLRYYEADKLAYNPDLVIAGSSHAYRGFNSTLIEQETGMKVFNLGSTGQSPYNTYFVLKKYLEEYHWKPKIVLMDIYWETLASEDGAESALDLISNSGLSKSIDVMTLKTINISVYNTWIAQKIFQSRKPFDLKDQGPDYGSFYEGKGYVSHPGNIPSEDLVKNLLPKRFNIESKQILYLKKTIDMLNEKGIKIFLVLTPVLPEWKNLTLTYASFCRSMDSLALKNHLNFINLNENRADEKMGINYSTDFYDKDHLSSGGVRKMNNFLLKHIDFQKLTYIP